MGGTECSPATPAAEGVPHGGMGGARTDGGHSVTGPILKKYCHNGKNMLPPALEDVSFVVYLKLATIYNLTNEKGSSYQLRLCEKPGRQ